jgi:hypothetical protein
MSLILIQTIAQAVSSTLGWVGFYIGIAVNGWNSKEETLSCHNR